MGRRSQPGKGSITLAKDSSLRKYARWHRRRGQVEPSVKVKNPERYLHAHARRRMKGKGESAPCVGCGCEHGVGLLREERERNTALLDLPTEEMR